jgi:D-ribose pyranose/furanose isomerase RbsD
MNSKSQKISSVTNVPVFKRLTVVTQELVCKKLDISANEIKDDSDVFHSKITKHRKIEEGKKHRKNSPNSLKSPKTAKVKQWKSLHKMKVDVAGVGE